MCKLLYWSTPVHPPTEGGGPPKTARRGVDNFQVVHRSTPICISSHSEEERREKTTRQYKENSRFGVDRWTAPGEITPPCGVSGWSTPSTGWVDRVARLSGEVTL